MGDTVKQFDAILFSGVAGVLGTVFIVVAMLGMLSNGETNELMLGGSIPASTITGILLLLTAGALGTNQRWARFLGILSFGAVVLFGGPSVTPATYLATVQVAVAGVATVYLIVRNPVSTPERSTIDESTSATRVGSTIR